MTLKTGRWPGELERNDWLECANIEDDGTGELSGFERELTLKVLLEVPVCGGFVGKDLAICDVEPVVKFVEDRDARPEGAPAVMLARRPAPSPIAASISTQGKEGKTTSAETDSPNMRLTLFIFFWCCREEPEVEESSSDSGVRGGCGRGDAGEAIGCEIAGSARGGAPVRRGCSGNCSSISLLMMESRGSGSGGWDMSMKIGSGTVEGRFKNVECEWVELWRGILGIGLGLLGGPTSTGKNKAGGDVRRCRRVADDWIDAVRCSEEAVAGLAADVAYCLGETVGSVGRTRKMWLSWCMGRAGSTRNIVFAATWRGSQR
jgi:hypothetical protein